ncbi:hypothetical protein VU06_03600 [Desulfobulbus sp. F3]|nr:hypothetical protein [Desulfobulbus sp. F3]
MTDVERELFRNIFPSEEQGGRPSARDAMDIKKLNSWHNDGTINEIKALILGLVKND